MKETTCSFMYIGDNISPNTFPPYHKTSNISYFQLDKSLVGRFKFDFFLFQSLPVYGGVETLS